MTDAIALTFAETVVGDKIVPTINNGRFMPAYRLLGRPNIKTKLNAKPYTEVTRKLVLAWCDSRTDYTGIYQAMYLTSQRQWPETRKYAIKILGGKVLSPYQVGTAACYLGQYGKLGDAKFLRQHLSNEAILRVANGNSKEIQIRDLVLAIMIELTKRDLNDFGIKKVNPNLKKLWLHQLLLYGQSHPRGSIHQVEQARTGACG